MKATWSAGIPHRPGLDQCRTSLDDARLLGKIIVFDFWTYGCINCLHVIPVLEQVEKKFADEVVVIGVHSAKFENEGQTENLRQICSAMASTIRSSTTRLCCLGKV